MLMSATKYNGSFFTPHRALEHPHERSHSDMMLLSHWFVIGFAVYSFSLNKEFCILMLIVFFVSYM